MHAELNKKNIGFPGHDKQIIIINQHIHVTYCITPKLTGVPSIKGRGNKTRGVSTTNNIFRINQISLKHSLIILAHVHTAEVLQINKKKLNLC